ncbi:MAG: Alpha-galactosidase, GH36 family [Candidatus Saccharicenans subterraneus]|uniref:Alpha-galactosidase, GH36 family n=1 Tax=Candidatus Saccharicenans subterraneus TaxID=2508984 RepID=A0A3E2BKU4_9BACT|nr:MAG: Alpha-galactosidase, GH36 family [Candidatus Saccharicenans subterraneum]
MKKLTMVLEIFTSNFYRYASGRTRIILIMLLLTACWLFSGCGGVSRPTDSYNVFPEIKVKGPEIIIEYRGEPVFTGKVITQNGTFSFTRNIFQDEKALTGVVALTAARGIKLNLAGQIKASAESFPCEADRSDSGPVVVRHVSGLSRSRLNRAVYDRRSDWVLSVDSGPRVQVSPLEENPEGRVYAIEASGSEIILRFRPAYYRLHRGLKYYEPWTYRLKQDSVAGWISWFAFYDRVTEADIVETAETMVEKLLPFGYKLLQIDDGYQRGEGQPELWLQANDKFPRGLSFLASYLKGKGLVPGLWTNVAFKQVEFVQAHPDWFVQDNSGRPGRGNWVEYSLDGSVEKALDEIVRPVYRTLRNQGWKYFKVDALRHLRYEGYNAHSGYFIRKKVDREKAFRRYVEVIREEIGPESYLLGCWGIRPELVGLLDGCRIGTDGFSYAGLAQFNSWNNVVWRNDPDHIQLDEERYRSLLVTSLTGSILLLTDKPAVYHSPAVEPARRAAPVLWTVPGQIFDVDPSRSSLLDRVGAEVSGSGPRPFDAGLRPACDLWLLEIVRPFENWLVLGRTGESEKKIRFSDLGLDDQKEYFVFEFWSKQLVGSFNGGFEPGPLDPVYRSQCFIIRERMAHPQLLATSRHLTGGGPDLLDTRWEGDELSAKCQLAAGDPYELYIHIPPGWNLDETTIDGASLESSRRQGSLLMITLQAGTGGQASWTIRFSRTR